MQNKDEALIRTALAQLALDDRFRLFMQAVGMIREQAVAELCANQAVADTHVTAAYVGEIRALRDIEAMYQEALKVRGVNTDDPAD